MAKLSSNTLDLEIKVTWRDSRKFFYAVEVTKQGRNIFSDTMDADALQSPDTDPLQHAIRKSLSENEPVMWVSQDGRTVAIFPCHTTLGDLFRWMTSDGQKWLIDDTGQHQCCWEPEDAFTLIIEFSIEPKTRPSSSGQGWASTSYTFHTTRRDLECFARELSTD